MSLGGIGVVMGWDVARSLLPMTISEAVFSYELAVVPMFILMGTSSPVPGFRMTSSAANAFPRPVRGGLALVDHGHLCRLQRGVRLQPGDRGHDVEGRLPSMKRYGYSDALAWLHYRRRR